MILTTEQQRWCHENSLGIGFDDDDETKEQWTHICETVGEGAEEHLVAICGSPRLWFGAGRNHLWPALDEDRTDEQRAEASVRWADVTCEACLVVVKERGLP